MFQPPPGLSLPEAPAMMLRGAGFTEPYADPTSGEGLVSFVAPLRERAGGPVVGVVIAGSFLDPRGDAKGAAEI